MVNIPNRKKARAKQNKQNIRRKIKGMRAVLEDERSTNKQVSDVLRQVALYILDMVEDENEKSR